MTVLRIGLTQRVDFYGSYKERRDALDQNWAAMIEQLGHVPIPLSNKMQRPREYIEALILDAVVLTGGNDVASLPDVSNPAPERDRLEASLIDYCADNRKPMLAVCRGLQMLNLYLGGNLTRVSGHVGAHALRGAVFNSVNSFHDWAIAPSDLAKPLEGLASAPDGTIEAVRHMQMPWVGVMWHPERLIEQPELQRSVVGDALAGQLPKAFG